MSRPARNATAATALPAPRPAARTARGGEEARKTVASAMIAARPGRMKQRPPSRAPALPRSHHAQ